MDQNRVQMPKMKIGNNVHQKRDFYYIVLGGYMDSKEKSAFDIMLKQIYC